MKRYHRFLLCLIFPFLAAGCATAVAWTYQPNAYHAPAAAQARPTATAAVLPFEDRRENLNYDHTAYALIPLVPYGRLVKHTPPGMQLLVNPPQYFAKALADELRASDLYKAAYFAQNPAGANFIFKGDIINTDFKSKFYSYGTSIFAGLTWMLGLPVAHVTNDLTLKLACENSNGQTLFQKTYSATPYHVWIDMYYLEPNINYPNMTKQIYGEFVQDLAASGKCMSAPAAQALNSGAPALAHTPRLPRTALADMAHGAPRS